MLFWAINDDGPLSTEPTPPMKALTLLATILTIILCISYNETYAGGNDGGNGSPAPVVRRDLVGPDFQPATKESIILMREVRKTANGYQVKVKAANGSLRMMGTFSDEQLTQANGTFSYYHDNGRLESEGRIVNGVKSGVWTRFDRCGNPKSEKIYDGQTYDQLAVSNGWNPASN
jgi:hypothetical protein